MYTYCPYDNDIANQLLNVLPCNMHVVHPSWECNPRLTSLPVAASRGDTGRPVLSAFLEETDVFGIYSR